MLTWKRRAAIVSISAALAAPALADPPADPCIRFSRTSVLALTDDAALAAVPPSVRDWVRLTRMNILQGKETRAEAEGSVLTFAFGYCIGVRDVLNAAPAAPSRPAPGARSM